MAIAIMDNMRRPSGVLRL